MAEGIEQQVMAEDQETSRVREMGIGAVVPPASEPLQAKVLNSLADVIVQTADKLAPGGELGEIVIQPVKGTVDQVPADLAAKVATFAGFAQAMSEQYPELEPYVFDPGPLMTSNAGLDEIQAIIGGMGSDRALIKALSRPPKSGVTPEKPEQADDMAADDELDMSEEV